MKTFIGFLIGIFTIVCGVTSMKAQDVIIEVPAANIFNRIEFTTIENVLNTRSHSNWRARVLSAIWPEIESTSGNNYSHKTSPNVLLPTTVLEWQLKSIGGQNAPFRNQDDWPIPYKSFSSKSQYWYQPSITTGNYTPGNVAFSFRIPSDRFSGNAFHAGQYSLGVTHNYTSSGWFNIEFTPNNFNSIISVPTALQWLSTAISKNIEISSLNDYRTTADRILGNLGNAELGNTVDFNLLAKASSANIQFTSSKGVTGTRSISTIQLGSQGSELTKKSLSATSQNFSASIFKVKVGNRNNFTPQFSVSNADFKAHFFEAGTYTFQLNFDAKSIDNSISSLQNTDVTLKVLPLSEITIPNSAQPVNFNFNTASHYANGQSQVVQKQIKLSNNESFELYVKSDGNYFKKAGVQTPIRSSILQIGIDGGSLMPLSTTAKKIITGGNPVLDQELNIKYNIPPAGAQSLVQNDKATYSINVIYSFIAL